MKILLLGYMGSGKSTVGQHLAEVLNIPFHDLDQEITNKTGKTISEIFKNKGELFFRKLEFQILNDVLESKNSFVMALGGGTPCYGNVMQQLKERNDVLTIFLNVSLPELTERLFPERKNRPLIAHLETKELLHDFIRKHLFERNFYYSQARLRIPANEPARTVVSTIILQLF